MREIIGERMIANSPEERARATELLKSRLRSLGEIPETYRFKFVHAWHSSEKREIFRMDAIPDTSEFAHL